MNKKNNNQSTFYVVWNVPEDLKSVGSSDVFMKKPRVGAYYKYIKLKNIVHEES